MCTFFSAFRIQNGLKQADVLSPLLSRVGLEYVIRKVYENQVKLKVKLFLCLF
jgi:hypothetical protein